MNFFLFDELAAFLYSIIYKNPEESTNSIDLNWNLVIISFLFVLVLCFVFFNLFKKKVNFKNYDPDEYGMKFKKITGLLLIVPLILIFDFIFNSYHLFLYRFLITGRVQSFLIEMQPSFWWSIFVYFIILSEIFLVFCSLFNLILFMNKKRVFKFFMLFYIPAAAVISGLKYFLITQVVEPNTNIIYTVFNQWSQTLSISIVLFLYVFFSRRINAYLSK